MRKAYVKLLLCVAALSLTGCMAMVFGTADQMNKISVGMTRQEVIQTLGEPKSISSMADLEYLQYRWVKTVIAADGNFPEDYFVAVRNGRVVSFGKKGDFDSTKLTSQRVEITESPRAAVSRQQAPDLYTDLIKLKALKDAGVISDAEFQAQKTKRLQVQ
ncbi:Short C-terminal domain-containing protein [Burkholderia sp. 8Y]|uniref:SHOCT domain-containing protein n=1 Tax=Burkholderia sp. 8Y TaxID=2653133 RepID=UPI0012EF0DC1|nr:SHOCT domain-containing protein [Burkholderia sp. 8Y]VXC44924.1 Short C-terminal domain-containing protein [Burkholderia sp. 8Y]